MSISFKSIQSVALLSLGDNTAYTCPVNTKAIIRALTVTNVSGAAATRTFNVVPSAGSVATTNQVGGAVSVAAGTSDLSPEVVGMTLNAGDTLHIAAGTATALSFTGTILEIV